jgi:predicted peptidase
MSARYNSRRWLGILAAGTLVWPLLNAVHAADDLAAAWVPDERTISLFSTQTFHYIADDQDSLLKYRLYIPTGVDASAAGRRQWPLLVWLHGFGESGDDNRAHIRWLELLFQENRGPFPCFVLAYQCPFGHRTWSDGPLKSQPLTVVKAVIDDVLLRFPINRERLYLSGVSSGGTACWEMLVRHPRLFAAAAPLASGGVRVRNDQAVPSATIWTFHCREDPQAPVESVRQTVSRVRALGGRAYLTETPGYTHDCWTTAFNDYCFVDWLLTQRKGYSGPEPDLFVGRVQWQLARQHIVGLGLHYYLAMPVGALVCVIVAHRQWKRRRHRYRNT